MGTCAANGNRPHAVQRQPVLPARLSRGAGRRRASDGADLPAAGQAQLEAVVAAWRTGFRRSGEVERLAAVPAAVAPRRAGGVRTPRYRPAGDQVRIRLPDRQEFGTRSEEFFDARAAGLLKAF